MSSDRFDRLRSIVLRALEAPTAERDDCLDRLCAGDSELRREAKSLLTAEGEVPDLVRTSGAHAGLAPADVLPETIGSYRILGVLGQGGMGTVYHAEQAEPIRRDVALKVIRAGQETADLFQRFELERRALALMRHPSIAQVYDAGATPEGVPYFAMEYVAGKPITDYCTEKDLGLSARLELFTRVCDGVGHAHRNGFIHRDIKPSNILIQEVEGRPVPKIIDFGIARATDQALSDRTRQTSLGQLIGTLEYMSPEQAAGDGRDVDTRTDVYSLGVVLYELLTGVHPLPRESSNKTSLEQILRLIREHEPQRPSTLVRRSAGSTLRGRLDQDLDWIALRALEKDRERRYGSVLDLAADLQRYQRHEPVMAGPVGPAYRVKKFVQRNRVAVAFGAVLAAVMLASVFAVATQWGTARLESARAAVINEFLTEDLLAAVAPSARSGRGRDVRMRDVLEEASNKIDAASGAGRRFADQPLIEASIRETLGWTYFLLGDYSQAAVHLEQADGIHRSELGEAHPDTLQTTMKRAAVYRHDGRYDEAEELHLHLLPLMLRVHGEEHPITVKNMEHFGGLYQATGRFRQAEEMYRGTLETRRRLHGNEHEETLKSMAGLAEALVYIEAYDEAEALTLETLNGQKRNLGPEHPIVLEQQTELGYLYMRQARHREAEAVFADTIDTAKRILGPDHPNTLVAMVRLANVYVMEDRHEEAEALHLKILEARHRVYEPENPQTFRSLTYLTQLYVDLAEPDEVEPFVRALIGIKVRQATKPGSSAYKRNECARLLLTCEPIGLRDPETALVLATEAVDLTEETDPVYLDTLALAQHMTGDKSSAIETEKKALALLAPDSPHRGEYQAALEQYEAADRVD
jgi:non-specific serine/threonine protein kinase/serine/threonine-protein kinase